MSDNDGADFLLKTLELQGIAISSVSDGHVIVFSRKFIQGMLDKDMDQDRFIIFLKRPDFKN
jgi:hypothetical protein